MSRFNLAYDIKRALERTVDLDDLLSALFADHPDLHTLEFESTNEYDDNNYSDYTRLQKVNGRQVDYDGEYEEEDEDETYDLPKASREACWAATNLCDFVKEKHGYGDIKFERGDHPPKKISGDPDLECALAFMKGEKLDIKTMVQADFLWWRHHAEIHGRFSPEDEHILFARENWMRVALEYAKIYGPLSEKTLNYFILSSGAGDEDYEPLQEYLEWARERAA